MTRKLQPWYWRQQHLENRTGTKVFAALFPSTSSEIAILLESPYPTPKDYPQLAGYSICAGSPRRVDGELQMWTPPLGQVLPFLQELLNKQGEFPPSPLPFIGGWFGWLGYDIAWEIEQLPHLKEDTLPFPIAFWYEPECFAILDHVQQILWLAAGDEAGLDELQRKLRDAETRQADKKEILNLRLRESQLSTTPVFSTSQQEYETTVNQAKKHIQAGDIFQANLSLRFQAQTAASGWEIYHALQKINPSPFASYWRTPWGEVVSCSPERLVSNQNGQVETRPIAGTRQRGATFELDTQLAEDLLHNSKERAEHIMLVDLERNDLGRVCEWGTVTVDELLTIERYSHVMHLVSNVKGTLKGSCTSIDLIRAMFPGGTITGCPKVRCMQIIEELEPQRRSLFYGSCGYLDWRGNLDLNILIRTLLVAQSPLSTPKSPLNTVWGQVGAGIVADSEPRREWYESLHKAQAQLTALKTSQIDP